MESRWSDNVSEQTVQQYAESGTGRDLALRVYTSRLLGQDNKLVLHGGGNTSVKLPGKDLLGEEVQVLHVKGSGWDMADIEPEGLPAVRLEPLLKLRHLDELSDEAMVNFERSNLLDSGAPTPSIETLLHAYLPHRFVDHTHSTAVLSLTNQPNGEELCREVFGDRMGIVPYIKPGFDLAKRAAGVFESRTQVEGLLLLKHGIFTFGATAREAYERMIAAVTLVEERLRKGRSPVFTAASLPARTPPVAEIAPIVRGACSLRDGSWLDGYRRFVMDFRTGPEIRAYVDGQDISRYSQVGAATPDHTIRTKNWPLILPAPEWGATDAFKTAVERAVEAFASRYDAYFERNNGRQVQPKTKLDPVPRVMLVPGLGLFGVGPTAKDAGIAADIAESTVETVTAAEAIGTFESAGESDLFDIEYWSLEQAKLGRTQQRPLAGQVVVVTGGGSGIGAATAAAFSREGAEVAVLDVDEAAGTSAIAVRCDVTDRESVQGAFDNVCETFGGVDIVVSNAGAAWQGRIGDVSDDVLRKSFELNFFAHQSVAQNAVRVMRAQGTGGVLLFNVSKQAVNPGPDFGPYGLPKAATLALARQYAVDHGSDGIRVNAVNADRIRSNLLTSEMIESRAAARGVSEEEYMSGNLLRSEVRAKDVAQAFVHLALQTKTTASVTTVDGGNIAAALR
jgi:rhamnose utilization protein RhaD (predicted bifunctional aldolase and dehydrogenase)/NAD(P)-dependent dehydrogenase (short-subunit alcohol dehydrogenase family)